MCGGGSGRERREIPHSQKRALEAKKEEDKEEERDNCSMNRHMQEHKKGSETVKKIPLLSLSLCK
jgi:hypothetical protein